MRPTVRCLVWDLDDTLWHGEAPLPSSGAVRTLHALDRRGILHAATGRRDHAVALSRHGLAELFAVQEFGRDTRSAPVRLAASTMAVPTGTVALVADDPVARAEVTASLPDVRCYPAAMVGRLPDLSDFTPAVITSDTRDRRHIFRAEQRRRTAEAAHPGTSASFVASLGLELEIRSARPADLLTASQFTASARAFGPADLRALSTEPGHEVLAASLCDRFGPYGIVGLAVLTAHEATTVVELLMCDRVLSLGAGTAFLDHVVSRSLVASRRPVAEFVPTSANRQLLVALRFAGFELSSNTGGHMTLTFDPTFPPKQHHPVRVVIDQG